MFADKLQKGASLYLGLIIMAIILAIAFGLSSIFLSQAEMIRGMGDSVVAFYAADAGIEKALMQRTDPTSLDGYSETMTNEASFTIFVLSSGEGDCTAANFCIKSVGKYKETRRAIEITY